MLLRFLARWRPRQYCSLLLSIGLCQFICAQTAPLKNLKFSKVIFDMTELLEEVVAGKSSKQKFISKVFSNPPFLRSKLRTDHISLLYQPRCNILTSNNCTQRIGAITKLVNETFQKYTKTIDLTISLGVDVPTILNLQRQRSKPRMDQLETPIKILLNWYDRCNHLEQIDYGSWLRLFNIHGWLSLDSSATVGFGYTETLMHCKSHSLSDVITEADFLVLNMRFGKTVKITESFGLFTKQMDALHEENLKFIKNNLDLRVGKTPKPVYYPASQNFENELHHRLLMTFAEKWARASTNGDKHVVIQTPYFELETIGKNLPVIPYIQSDSCDEYDLKNQNLLWYVPLAMAEISKYFNSFVMKHDQWKMLGSEIVEKLYNSSKTSDNNYIGFDVVLDYSDTLVHYDKGTITRNHCSYNWKEVEKELNRVPVYQLKNVVPKLILFQFSNYGTVEPKVHAPLDFAERISSKYQLGCKYKNSFHKCKLNESVAAVLVNACKDVYGTVYVLNSVVTLDASVDEIPGKYGTIPEPQSGSGSRLPFRPNQFVEPDYYGDGQTKYRPSLLDPIRGSKIPEYSFKEHYEGNVRKELEAADRFRKQILAKHPSATVYLDLDIKTTQQTYVMENYKVVAFCNPAVFERNLYIEEIVNWARLNDFPLIMKTAFDYIEQQTFSSWLSFLRPVSFLTQKEGEVVKRLNGSDQYPSFVLRNYPEGFNNWTVDPCVEWTEDVPNIGLDYFHIGAVLNTRDFERTEESDEIMLHFVAHRFQFTEILITENGLGVLKALQSLTSKDLIGSNRHFFISYNKLTTGKMENINLFNKIKIPSLKGTHFDLKEIQTAVGKLETGLLEAWMSWVKPTGLKVGIALTSSNCMDLVGLVITREPSAKNISNLLPKLNYIVCSHELDVLLQDDQKHLGYFFDTHLYLKRIFKQFQPNLQLYFRVELKLDFDDDKDKINRFLRTISFFNKFGSMYDMEYFLVEAFDSNSPTGKNGWWAIKNYTTLADPYAYVEKESVYSDRVMWYPPVPVSTKISNESSVATSVIATVSTILLLLFVGISGFLYVRYKNLRNFLTKEEVEEFLHGKQKGKKYDVKEESQFTSAMEYMEFKSNFDLLKVDLITDSENVLGVGNFGTVYKGKAKGIEAAIKIPKNGCPKGTFKSMLTEIKILCYIGTHSNVVGFYGAYIKEINKGILLVATELCSNGSLESYLRKKTKVVVDHEDGVYQNTQLVDSLNFHELHGFSNDIASGMAYIESKHVVHGDLSTRNVLLDEYFNCKIGDFGLSRKLYEYQKYVKKSQEPLPWKWMAYESLAKMEFASKSDVWSYGVTLFEIYTLGGTPYGGLNWTMGFADELRNGLRLAQPHFASEEIYAKMLECWTLDAEQRPTFSELAEFFKKFCRADYIVFSE